jgi:hypothetical protein
MADPNADYVRATCRHCGKPLVHDGNGWRLPAAQVRLDNYYDEAAWLGCVKAPAPLGFIGKHDAHIDSSGAP